MARSAPVTSYAAGAPAWVDLATPDPEAAKLFYGALFGWQFSVGPADTGNYTMCRGQGLLVAGMQGQPAPPGEPHAWTVHLASEDVGVTAERITAAGGTVLMGPRDVLEEGRMVLAADPAGARFGVWEAGSFAGAELVGIPGAVTWSELSTTDLDAATAFYGSVFDHAWELVDTGRDGPRYATLTVAGEPVAGVLEMMASWPQMAPQWSPYFAVADLDAATESVRRLGGRVLFGPTEIAVGRFANIVDPQGVAFTIVTPPSQG